MVTCSFQVNKPRMPLRFRSEGKTPNDMVKSLGEIGIDLSDVKEVSRPAASRFTMVLFFMFERRYYPDRRKLQGHFRSRSKTRSLLGKRKRSVSMDTGESKSRARTPSRDRSKSGVRDVAVTRRSKSFISHP